MQQAIEGFKILMIYEVPPGVPLNKDNYDQFPLKECGTWISDDLNWMIQDNTGMEEEYQLIPHSDKARRWFFSRVANVVGNLESIRELIKKFNGKSNS